jgi:hypothetical protein
MAQLCPTSACSKLLSDFPNINFIRVVWENGYNTSGMEPYIGWLTALGIVVEICDFNQSPSAPPVSGSTLTQSINWYSTLAQTYKNNPYVWYESQNEMYGAGATMASNQQQLYNAVRAQTSTGIVVFGLPGGGNIGTVGTSGNVNGSTMTASVYAPMHNIIWDLHFYAYVVNNIVGSYSTDIPTIQNVLNGSVAGAYGIFATQSIRSADGLVPVIIGEVGNSTTGQSLDPNGSQVVQAAATDTNAQGFGAYAVGTYAIGITCCNALSDSNQNLTSPYGVFVNNLVQQNSSGRGGTGVGAVGAGWGTGTGGDVRAMANDVGAAIQAADPGVLVLVEGPLNNGSLFNGTARGSSSFPITAGSISDLSSVGTLPVTCCAGHLGYVVHDTPTSLSGVAPDSGNGATTMRNTAWGYLITQGRAPVWIGKMGASLDGTNGSLADETGWATSLTQYMNGQLGAQGGPTFSGCTMPMSGDWFNYGYLPSQQPDGTLNQNNSNKSGQQGYWSTLLYTTCTGGGGGVGATTWNPNDASPNISLSPDNLVATQSGASSNSVRSTTSQSTGRICFAAVATTISPNWDIGIANSTYNLEGGGGLGADGNGIGFDPRSAGGLQGIFFNNALLSSGAGTSPNGEEEMICADLDAKLLWATNATMRGNGNPWNNSPTANPATGTGGMSFAGLTCPCFITWNEEEAGVAALNAAGPFAVSIPSGFSAWQQPITSGGRVILLNFAN